MSWFKNLRLTPKLVGSFSLMAVLAAIVAGATYLGLSAQNAQVTHLKNVSFANVSVIQDAQSDMNAAIRYSRAAVLASTTTQITTYGDKAIAFGTQAQQDWQASLALPVDNAQEQALANQTTPLLPQGATLDARVVQLARQNTATAKAAATRISIGNEPTTANQITANLAQLRTMYEVAMRASESSAATAFSTAKAELAGVLALAILLALALGIFIAHSLVRPLAQVQAAASSVANVCMTGLAEGLAALASGLKETVDRFTLDATTITSAKAKTEKVRPIRAVA